MLSTIKWKKKLLMNNKKSISMLGMARRAGKLAMGHDMALNSIKDRKSKLVIFASDISPRLIKEFENTLINNHLSIKCIKLDETINELYMALGYKAGVMSVDDANFSSRIEELLSQEGNKYGN